MHGLGDIWLFFSLFSFFDLLFTRFKNVQRNDRAEHEHINGWATEEENEKFV